MIEVRRLSAVGAFLSLAAIVTCSDLWGDPGKEQELQSYHKGGGSAKPAPAAPATDGPAAEPDRFATQPVQHYRDDKGDSYVAVQVRPALPDVPARPRDFLVVVDTAASKAGGPLALAQQLVRELAAGLGKGDRLALWTANVAPRDLSRGFRAAADLESALKELGQEVPMGAVSLKKCLGKALDSFEGRAGRQQVVLFLGDGRSLAGPVDADDRAELAARMVRQETAFFAVPLGQRLDAQTLHGLAGMTGGLVVRLGGAEQPGQALTRLLAAVAEPVLYPTAFRAPQGMAEAYPTRLPPPAPRRPHPPPR